MVIFAIELNALKSFELALRNEKLLISFPLRYLIALFCVKRAAYCVVSVWNGYNLIKKHETVIAEKTKFRICYYEKFIVKYCT